MKTTTYLRWTTLLSGAGAIFAGYLSSVGLRSGLCAFGDPCPVFLGRPAYYTSLALFSAILLVSVLALFRERESRWPAVANVILSALGVLFATRLTVGDLWALAGGASHRTAFPTCAYGFGFFVAIVVLSLAVVIKSSGREPTPA